MKLVCKDYLFSFTLAFILSLTLSACGELGPSDEDLVADEELGQKGLVDAKHVAFIDVFPLGELGSSKGSARKKDENTEPFDPASPGKTKPNPDKSAKDIGKTPGNNKNENPGNGADAPNPPPANNDPEANAPPPQADEPPVSDNNQPGDDNPAPGAEEAEDEHEPGQPDPGNNDEPMDEDPTLDPVEDPMPAEDEEPIADHETGDDEAVEDDWVELPDPVEPQPEEDLPMPEPAPGDEEELVENPAPIIEEGIDNSRKTFVIDERSSSDLIQIKPKQGRAEFEVARHPEFKAGAYQIFARWTNNLQVKGKGRAAVQVNLNDKGKPGESCNYDDESDGGWRSVGIFYLSDKAKIRIDNKNQSAFHVESSLRFVPVIAKGVDSPQKFKCLDGQFDGHGLRAWQ